MWGWMDGWMDGGRMDGWTDGWIKGPSTNCSLHAEFLQVMPTLGEEFPPPQPCAGH